jgi:hypothetical protein
LLLAYFSDGFKSETSNYLDTGSWSHPYFRNVCIEKELNKQRYEKYPSIWEECLEDLGTQKRQGLYCDVCTVGRGLETSREGDLWPEDGE